MLKIFLILHFFICVGILIAQPIDTTYESSTQATQDPTYSNIVKPQNVLVVFRNDDSVSIAIKNYYVNKRGILATNVLGLDIPDTADYDGERVILWHGTEVIKRDDYCSDDGSNGVCDTLVWHYYNEKIALPTSSYLNNTFDNSTNQYLKDQIDYIVLCKGIPIKLNSGDRGWLRYWPSYNISLDGLLCLLQTENNNNPSIMKLYPIPPTYGYNCYVDNTYRGIDLSFNFNHRFKANHYITNKTLNDNTTAEFKIACLVSHLDGRNLTDVLRMIDNNCLAISRGRGNG